ncbi:ABC transporter ATP-binding protein [Clostridium cellulovorans]|uniref:ABC transporter related n=1 Tax=Clostridium cellulovorans (strain ATCC 35296 / DSM 3052 / OCM 3 / 743B) TaxID=573061 RepID=D9SQJ1_CLOC7|nr:ABC transporter ATP-binding protein [Clostridium cellulovorans]ADL52197.1 ABC transporter related [Clostridium cellulovorans 743B]
MFKLIGINEFKRLMSYMKPRMKSYLIGLFGQGIGNAIIYIILAFVLKDLVQAADEGNMSIIFQSLKLIGSTVLLLVIFLPIFFYYYKKAVRTTMVEIKKEVFDKIQKLPIEYFDKNHSGNIISRFNNDTLLAEKAFTEGLREIITTAVLGIGSAVIMFLMDWKITLALLGLGLLLSVINMRFAEPIRNLSDKIQTHNGLLTERFTDQLAGFFIVKMFKTENIVKKRFIKYNNEVTGLAIERVNKTAVLEGTNFFLSMIGFAGSLIIGTIMVIRGEIEFATLAAIVQLQLNISDAFLSVGRCFSTLQISLASAGRIFELLDMDEEAYRVKSELISDISPVIEFKDTVYSYNGIDNVLDKISLTISKGNTVAFVGPSGGGKSTLLKLILGFYTANEGAINLYGKSLYEYSFEEIRDSIAYVPQESYLFSDTIKENIRYGRYDATDEEIYNAAKSANVHDFIETLPNGYDTIVEEGGKNISGGQRQRIAIARAFLKNSPIILLDEATSALDTENEQKIKMALESLMKGKTVIVVAHRLSTIKNADKIFVIDGGRVVEEGNHNELIGREGMYCGLIHSQIK